MRRSSSLVPKTHASSSLVLAPRLLVFAPLLYACVGACTNACVGLRNCLSSCAGHFVGKGDLAFNLYAYSVALTCAAFQVCFKYAWDLTTACMYVLCFLFLLAQVTIILYAHAFCPTSIPLSHAFN